MLVVRQLVAQLSSVHRCRLLDGLLLLVSRRHLLLNLMLVLSLLGHALLTIIRIVLLFLLHLEASAFFKGRAMSNMRALNLVLHVQVQRCYLLLVERRSGVVV